MAPALQISIPTTSTTPPTPSSKPYTLYHIHLRLPLRLHEVRKRYTDFTNLHSALQTETSAPPPAPLPGKTWLRRTVASEALTENRRAALEHYVQRIVDAEDARWRSSAAWRGFMNLPGGNANGETKPSGATRPTSSSGGGAGGIRDPNEWLDVHRVLKTHIQAARSELKNRDAATTAQQQHVFAAQAKGSLVRAAAGCAQLDDALKRFSADGDGRGKLGAGEVRRRRDLVSAARSEVEGLEGVLKSMPTRTKVSGTDAAQATRADGDALWKGSTATAAASSTGGRAPGRVLGGPPRETDRTRERDNTGVLQLQQQIMKEQDEDVLEMGKTVAKLKDMGILINEELEIQNEMLGLVENDVERVQGKIDIGRRRIGKIK